MLKSIGLAAVMMLSSSAALAHESEPELDPDPALAAMRYCQTVGVRAAWGAQARFLGAPAQFKYIAQAPLKRMFMGETTDIPTDAIYVLEDMDLDQRREYEENAFFGWKQADAWVREGRERPCTRWPQRRVAPACAMRRSRCRGASPSTPQPDGHRRSG